MSASNRANLIGKLHTSLKKHYEVPPAQPTRPLLEHVLYASLLEDCHADLADEALAKCEQEFFDWNEVRVTTATELSQVFSRLPDPLKSATRLKGNLQAIFEEFYTFDLDHLKKENLGKAVVKFEQMPSMTPFVLNYTIQYGLGGHAIPVDYSAMVLMLVLGIASPSEASSGRVPGLERAIPKNKGIEFSSLLHQAAVALHDNPKDKNGRAMLDATVKGSSKQLDEWLKSRTQAKQRAAKRRTEERAEERAAAEADAEAKQAAADKSKKPGKARPTAKAAKPTKTVAPTKSATKSAPKKKTKAKKSTSTESGSATKKTAAPRSSGKKTPPKSKSTKSKPPSKPASKSSRAGKTDHAKKSTSRKLVKRKPR